MRPAAREATDVDQQTDAGAQQQLGQLPAVGPTVPDGQQG